MKNTRLMSLPIGETEGRGMTGFEERTGVVRVHDGVHRERLRM